MEERHGLKGPVLKGPVLKGRSLWALLFGSLTVLIQYFLNPLIVPGEFGFSRWMSGFVDIIGLPVFIPFIACFLLVALRVFPATVDYAGFALLWLVPQALIRSISGSSPFPIALILVPILWVAQTAGITFFITLIIRKPRKYVVILSILGIAALITAATTSWWAFFGQRTLLGYLLLVVCFVPAAAYFIKSGIRNEELRKENNEELGVRNQELEDLV